MKHDFKLISGSRSISTIVLSAFFVGGLCFGIQHVIGISSAQAADPQKNEVVAPAPEVTPSPSPDDEEEEGGKKKEKKEKVVTGVIAAQGNYGQFASIKSQTAGSSPGDEGGVITGSVSWTPGDICKATINNNGEKTYSVYFVINGVSQTGSKVFSKTASGTVKPKTSMVREVFGCKKDVNLNLELRSAKPLS